MVRTRTSSVESDPVCPICLERLTYAVETNCGHLYCADCILEVRRNEPSVSPICCPFCRQDVTILLACFTISEVEATSSEEQAVRDRVQSEIRDYNRIFCQHPRSKPPASVNQQQQDQTLTVNRHQQDQTLTVNRHQQDQTLTVQLNSSNISTGAAVVVGVGAVLIAGALASLGIGLARLAIGSARRRD